jgi:hypothetical protein
MLHMKILKKPTPASTVRRGANSVTDCGHVRLKKSFS